MNHLHLGKILEHTVLWVMFFLCSIFSRLNRTYHYIFIIFFVILLELNELTGTLPTELGGLTAAEYVRLCT